MRLKRCPFCGTKDPYDGVEGNGWGDSYVSCRNDKCRARVTGRWPGVIGKEEDNRPLATTIWNRRVK